MINALVISKNDNVCIVIEPVKKDDDVVYRGENGKEYIIKAKEDIPVYHKVAVKDIEQNEYIIKYGEHIGTALKYIFRGEHIHEHNIKGMDRAKAIIQKN